MTDHAAPTRTQASARRPALSQTILSVAATAIAVAALIWSALFYDATRNHAAALHRDPHPTRACGDRCSPAGAHRRARHHPHIMTAPFTEHEHHFDVFGTQVRLLVGAPAGEPLHRPARRAARAANDARPPCQADALRARQRAVCDSTPRSGQPIAVSSTLLHAVQAAIFAAEVSDGTRRSHDHAASGAGRLRAIARGGAARGPARRAGNRAATPARRASAPQRLGAPRHRP